MIDKHFRISYWKSFFYYIRGLSNFTKENYNKAFGLFQVALNSMQSAAPDAKGLCFKYMGICCLNMNRLEEAKLYLFKARDIIGDGNIDSELSARIASVYFNEGNYVQAKRYYELAFLRYKNVDLVSRAKIKEALAEIDKLLGRGSE